MIELSVLSVLWIVFLVLLTSSQGAIRSSNAGIIVPPNPANKTTKDAVYDPLGKRPAPTHIAGGVVPPQLQFGKGTVVASKGPVTSSSSGKVIHQTSQGHSKFPRPVQSQQPSLSDFISQLLGGATNQNPFGATGDLNIQIVQPFYNRPRPGANGYYYGMVRYGPESYGSYQNQQRHGQEMFDNQEEQAVVI